jgi:taurine dioxygenase
MIILYVNCILFALGAVHPLVCTHPETKRKCLYLGRRRNGYVMGLKLEDSEALLDELWNRITGQPTSSSSPIEKGPSGTGSPGGPFTWFNEWNVGDLVLWDNRCTMHRRDAFDPNERRVMHRTQIKGTTKPSA